MCATQLTEPRGGTRQHTDDNPKASERCTDEIGAAGEIKQNWFQQSHETSLQGDKELKSGKDKDHNKNCQDGLTRDSYPSKLGLQPTHSKKYAPLQTFVNSHYVASKLKSKQKSNRSIRFILTYNYYFHT